MRRVIREGFVETCACVILLIYFYALVALLNLCWMIGVRKSWSIIVALIIVELLFWLGKNVRKVTQSVLDLTFRFVILLLEEVLILTAILLGMFFSLVVAIYLAQPYFSFVCACGNSK